MKKLIARNKHKISRAFQTHSYWRERLSTSKAPRHYYRCAKGEFVWIKPIV
jgi:hypothetical protein